MNGLVFKTKNSTYKVELCSEGFKLTKIGEVKSNTSGINLGYTKTAWNLYLRIGEPARMGGLTTTPVLDITTYDQWEKEIVK